MYIRNFEIEHMRKKHPQLLNQISQLDMYEVKNKTGFEVPEKNISDVMFITIMDALQDAIDTRKAEGR